MAGEVGPVPRGREPVRPVTHEHRALMDAFLAALRDGTAPIDRLLDGIGRGWEGARFERRLTPIPMAMVVSRERWEELYGTLDSARTRC